jgi:hypothetical protein
VKNIFQKGQNKKIHLKLCLFELEKILAFIQLHGKEIGLSFFGLEIFFFLLE